MRLVRWCVLLGVCAVGLLGVTGCGDDSSTGELRDEDGDGYTILDGDCDDADPAVHPGATEVCNGVDDDCVEGW